MYSNEIDIVIKTEEGKKYLLGVPKVINFKFLRDKIQKNLAFIDNHFCFEYNSKIYSKNNENDILNLNQGDIIMALKTVITEGRVKIKFHMDINLNEADKKVLPLSGILQICLLEFIAKRIDNVEKIKSAEIKNIILELKNDMDLTNNPQKDIQTNLSQKNGSNIITYKNYINELIKANEINYLLNLMDQKRRNEVYTYWSILSKYEDFNQLFEKDFTIAIENCYFDYSLIAVSIYQQKRRNEYLSELRKCQNATVNYVFHGTHLDPISKIIMNGFLYSRKPFYGMGIYFSDMLDYVSFYGGGNSYETRRDLFGKTLPVGETFSCVGTEIYYSKDQKKQIYDWSYHVDELNHFPTYDEIKKKWPEKMIPKNAVHFIRVEPQQGQVYGSENIINQERRKGKFIGNEYVITEMSQIFPLYGLTLRRNEYIVIWRDPNFSGQNEFSQYLKGAKMYLYKNENINAFIESSTEKALELIKRKKFNKIILISSIGLDLSGKKFVEVARKILGFDVIVLFFSSNYKHLQWIQKFPNALYTDNYMFYQQYVKNYNQNGLLNLKKQIENNYKIKLQFTNNFLQFPKFVGCRNYSDLTFDEFCPNFRKIIIKNKINKKALQMNINGTVQFVPYEGIEINALYWYVTIIGNEITLFSNNFYLYVDGTNRMAKGHQFMIRWKCEQYNGNYIIYLENKNNVLSIDKERAIIIAQNNNYIYNQLFELFDV